MSTQNAASTHIKVASWDTGCKKYSEPSWSVVSKWYKCQRWNLWALFHGIADAQDRAEAVADDSANIAFKSVSVMA